MLRSFTKTELLVLLFSLLAASSAAQTCGGATDCLSCLQQKSGCAWSSQHSCIPDDCSSLPTGSFCYSPKVFRNLDLTGICELYDTREADSIICNVPTDCESCTSTLKSDGISTCRWYQRSGRAWCGSGASLGVNGIGSCPSPIVLVLPGVWSGRQPDGKTAAGDNTSGGNHRLRF